MLPRKNRRLKYLGKDTTKQIKAQVSLSLEESKQSKSIIYLNLLISFNNEYFNQKMESCLHGAHLRIRYE